MAKKPANPAAKPEDNEGVTLNDEGTPPELTKEPPLGMDPNDATDDDQADDEAPRPRQGAVNILCPYHGVRCVSRRSDALVTKYYCPEPGCTYMQKVPRPDFQARLNRQRTRDRQQEGFSARD